MENETDVVIVGGGPIGLTLSYILGKNNISNVLLEKNETTSDWAKAAIINPRSMELYRRLGLDSIFREKALPGGLVLNLSTSLLNKPTLLRAPLSQMVGKNPRENKDGTTTFEKVWTTEEACRLSQLFMEPMIRAETSKFESSDVKFGWNVHSVTQTQENVQVEAVNVKTGEKKLYRARYAVGCDGGKSLVRKLMGIHFKGTFDLAKFKTVVFSSPEFKKRVLNDCMISMLAIPGFQVLVVRLDNEGQFAAHAFVQDGKETTADEIIGSLMDNEDIPYTITFQNQWKGHFAATETLQNGRVFLAGDACHVVIPVGGFGMNTGVLDAYDLGWKLVGTINGWGGEQLLPSYTIERHHGIQKVVERITRLFYSLRNVAPILVFLANTSPFKHIMRLFLDPLNIIAGVSGILFGIRLDTSPLCIPSSRRVPSANLYHYLPVAHPGCRAPHFQFEDGTTLYDKLGSMFTLVHLQPSTKSFDPILAAAAHCGIPLKVLSLNNKRLKNLYMGMDFVIIRPDLYIAWCGDEIPTLLHNDDVNEGARVLMKVITGNEVLPPEWKRKRKEKGSIRSVLWFPALTLVLTGVFAIMVSYLREPNPTN